MSTFGAHFQVLVSICDFLSKHFCIVHHAAETCALFSYLTVDVVVTNPAGWDAGRVSALELTGSAGGRSTVQLVGTVAAVILAVADKVAGNATAAGTGELIWSTGDVSWKAHSNINSVELKIKGLNQFCDAQRRSSRLLSSTSHTFRAMPGCNWPQPPTKFIPIIFIDSGCYNQTCLSTLQNPSA